MLSDTQGCELSDFALIPYSPVKLKYGLKHCKSVEFVKFGMLTPLHKRKSPILKIFWRRF